MGRSLGCGCRVPKTAVALSTTASLVALPQLPKVWSVAARTSWQSSDDGVDQSYSHGGDRVWNVSLRPQGELLWVGSLWIWQVSGIARRDELLRGESSPVRRSGSRRPRCTWSRDCESQAIPPFEMTEPNLL